MSVHGALAITGNGTGQTTDATPGVASTITAALLSKSVLAENNIDVSSSALTQTVLYADSYELMAAATITGDAAGYSIGIYKNGSVIAFNGGSLAGSDSRCIPVIGIDLAEVGDVYDVRIASTSASKSVTVTDMQFTVIRRGGG